MQNNSIEQPLKLSAWLAKLEALHPQAVDFDLERVYSIAMAMELLCPPSSISHKYSGSLSLPQTRVVTVGGTNGKGSCCKIIEQCALASSLTVGSYNSPHLLHYCERITINGKAVSESQVCRAFAEIDRAREDKTLTYFEFGTLAALWLFQHHQVDIVILEVGVGGRLDATNIVDADIAVITNIAMDHQHWLGHDRDAIAGEKAGICRRGRPIVCSDSDPPKRLLALNQLDQSGPDKKQHNYWIGNEFNCQKQPDGMWLWQSQTENQLYLLPKPQLPIPSIAAGLQVASLLNILPTETALQALIARASLPGRHQCFKWRNRECIIDVAHNPAATQLLAKRLDKTTINGKTRAVFAAMADKDINTMLAPLFNCIDQWYIGELADNPRAASTVTVATLLKEHHQRVTETDNINTAWTQALTDAGRHDRIVVFGSFYTAEAILTLIRQD